MRWLLMVAALLVLGACDPAVSRRPLLAQSGAGPQVGLWALLEPDCPAPTTDSVQTWPECATPVWVKPGEVITIQRSPVRSEFVTASGEPRIAQVAGENVAGERRYSYFAFRTLGAPPHRSALVWFIFCDGERGRTKAAADEAECLVEDEAELRRLARLAADDADAAGRAVYIEPG